VSAHALSEVEISRLKIGLVGAGGMGANHARVLAEADFVDFTTIVDVDAARASEIAEVHGARASNSLDALDGCDAAVIATNTASHMAIARYLVDLQMPLLIEKPIAPDVNEVVEILENSRRANVPISCGFVERFNPALVTALELIEGPVIQLHAVRHSPRNSAATATVVQDLLIHDIDLAFRVNQGTGVPKVTGATWRPKSGELSEIADCILRFDDTMVGNLSASRWGQRKIREVLIATEELLIEVDLLRVNVTVYRNISQSLIQLDGRYRAETIVDVPYVRHRGEPLATQLASFAALVRSEDPDAAEKERESILPPHVVAAAMDLL